MNQKLQPILLLAVLVPMLIMESCHHESEGTLANTVHDTTLVERVYRMEEYPDGTRDTTWEYNFEYDNLKRISQFVIRHVGQDSLAGFLRIFNYHYTDATINPAFVTDLYKYPGDEDDYDTTFFRYDGSWLSLDSTRTYLVSNSQLQYISSDAYYDQGNDSVISVFRYGAFQEDLISHRTTYKITLLNGNISRTQVSNPGAQDYSWFEGDYNNAVNPLYRVRPPAKTLSEFLNLGLGNQPMLMTNFRAGRDGTGPLYTREYRYSLRSDGYPLSALLTELPRSYLSAYQEFRYIYQH